jgi:hypothetical protein
LGADEDTRSRRLSHGVRSLLLGTDVEVDGTAVTMRAATALDADVCGRVIHAAFGTVNTLHGFETRWPSAEFAAAFARDFLARRGIYGWLPSGAAR